MIVDSGWIAARAGSIHLPLSASFPRQNAAVHPHVHAGVGAFLLQQLEDLFRAVVAEELAELLLVPRDAVALDEREEILRREAREGGLQEVRAAAGDVVGGGRAEVGEVAAPAAGDEDLVPAARVVLQQQHALAAQPRGARTEQPRGPAADHDDIMVQTGHELRGNRAAMSRAEFSERMSGMDGMGSAPAIALPAGEEAWTAGTYPPPEPVGDDVRSLTSLIFGREIRDSSRRLLRFRGRMLAADSVVRTRVRPSLQRG